MDINNVTDFYIMKIEKAVREIAKNKNEIISLIKNKQNEKQIDNISKK